jgi:hypothetical protein
MRWQSPSRQHAGNGFVQTEGTGTGDGALRGRLHRPPRSAKFSGTGTAQADCQSARVPTGQEPPPANWHSAPWQDWFKDGEQSWREDSSPANAQWRSRANYTFGRPRPWRRRGSDASRQSHHVSEECVRRTHWRTNPGARAAEFGLGACRWRFVGSMGLEAAGCQPGQQLAVSERFLGEQFLRNCSDTDYLCCWAHRRS